MNNFNSLPRNLTIFFAALSGILVTSCGSYRQSSYYDNDGIYNDTSNDVHDDVVYRQSQQEPKNNTLYKDYFNAKEQQYNDILEEDAIFTDIDAYSSFSQDTLNTVDNYTYRNGNQSWGDNPSNVSINIYSDTYRSPWRYNSYWNWGWAYNNYWWYGGWYEPYWSYNYYWGYSNWYYPYYYSYTPYYYNRYYNYYPSRSRNYAYASGRRGYYNRNNIGGINSRSTYNRTQNYNSARRSITRNSTNRYYRNSNINRNSRTTPNYNSRNNSRYNNQSPTNRSYRQNSSTRRNTEYSRSSGSSRSSGNYRSSSGSSSRSSGGTRSSGRRGGGY